MDLTCGKWVWWSRRPAFKTNCFVTILFFFIRFRFAHSKSNRNLNRKWQTAKRKHARERNATLCGSNFLQPNGRRNWYHRIQGFVGGETIQKPLEITKRRRGFLSLHTLPSIRYFWWKSILAITNNNHNINVNVRILDSDTRHIAYACCNDFYSLSPSSLSHHE